MKDLPQWNPHTGRGKKHYEEWDDIGRAKLMKIVGTMSIADIAKEFGCSVDRIRTQCLKQQLSYIFKG